MSVLCGLQRGVRGIGGQLARSQRPTACTAARADRTDPAAEIAATTRNKPRWAHTEWGGGTGARAPAIRRHARVVFCIYRAVSVFVGAVRPSVWK